jgi:hypothetical protein
MPVKTASTRPETGVAAKSVPVAGAKPDAKTSRLSRFEAERLERFKALMRKYAGKATFAGFDE